MVFEANGRLIRVAGSGGQGPGEFLAPADIVPVPGDSVLILDVATRRGTVFGPTLVPGRSIRLTAGFRPAVVLDWPDTVVASAATGLRSSAGIPLHLVSFAGAETRILKSFGPGDETLRPGSTGSSFALLAGSRRGGFWSADLLQYRVSRWSRDGRLLASFEGKRDWFPIGIRYSMGNAETAPSTHIRALLEDDGHRIWVFVSVPRPSWRNAWKRVATHGGEVRGGALPVEEMFQSTVEVFSADRGQLLHRETLPSWVIAAWDNGEVAFYEVTAQGAPRIAIARLTLMKSPK